MSHVPAPRHLAGDPDAPTTDQVPLAAAALPFAILLGTALEALVLWGVRTLLLDAPPSDSPVVTGPAGNLLVYGTLGSAAAAALATWIPLAPVRSWFRRGGLAIVAAFATLVASFLATPLYHFFGRGGLLGLAAACAIGCVLVGRRLARVAAA